MTIPPKYEDVMAQLDAEPGRESALREELAALRESYESMRDRKNSIVELQQRLTVAEQRGGELEGMLRHFALCADVRSVGVAAMSFVAALKTAAEGEGS